MQITNFKKLVLISIILFVTFKVNGQVSEPSVEEKSRKVYLNLSSGLNNHAGFFSVGVLLPMSDIVSLRLGAGTGLWSAKFSSEIKFQNLSKSGFGFGVGYSQTLGRKNHDLLIGIEEEINFDFKPVGSLNLSINRNFNLSESMIFYLESGYSIATGGNAFYTANNVSDVDEFTDRYLNFFRPGGLILAMGFAIKI